MRKKKVYMAVINDLVTDRRVDRTCSVLVEEGFDVCLAGRRKRDSMPMGERPYDTHRMKLLFEKGALFYAFFNIRLFFFLLLKRMDILFANDLDTLLAMRWISMIRKKPLIYDSHEYFCGVPELANRPRVQAFWRRIEKSIFPKLKDIITVNDSIARLYKEEYGKELVVVRNIASAIQAPSRVKREELALPEGKTIVLMQGAGINIDRGAEELLEAMAFAPDFFLLIIGGGDVMDYLRKRSAEVDFSDRIQILPKVSLEKLAAYTSLADIGASLDKGNNINYKFSLPNKVFDYIHAGLPLICSDVVEVKKIVLQYDIGKVIPSHRAEDIAATLKSMIDEPFQMEKWKKNLKIASEDLEWEKEKRKLSEVFRKYA